MGAYLRLLVSCRFIITIIRQRKPDDCRNKTGQRPGGSPPVVKMS